MMVPESRKQQRAAFIALEEEMHSGGSGGWGAIDFSFNDSGFFFSFPFFVLARPLGFKSG